jgi:glycerol-3-phosphate dehydrogenase
MIRAGLFLYDRLGGKSATLPGTRGLDLRSDPMGAGLRQEFRKGFAYSDCRVDDARLVVVNSRDAADRGALILTRTRCTAARREGGLWHVTVQDKATGAERHFTARILVNAAGPWAGDVALRIAAVKPRQHLRLVKGSHVVVPPLYEGDHAFLLQNDDGRIVFVIPYEGRFSLVGTTDVAMEGGPGKAVISPEEVVYLQRAVAQYFQRSFAPADVVWSYAGIRPLYDDGAANPSAVTRDYVLELDGGDDAAPLLSVFGGKITTYRRLAEHALEKLAPFLPGLRSAWTANGALPGSAIGPGGIGDFATRLAAQYQALPEALVRGIARRHGANAAEVLGDARALGDLGEDFGGGLCEREVQYFLDREWAATSEDILWRRSKVGLHLPPEGAARLARYLGETP